MDVVNQSTVRGRQCEHHGSSRRDCSGAGRRYAIASHVCPPHDRDVAGLRNTGARPAPARISTWLRARLERRFALDGTAPPAPRHRATTSSGRSIGRRSPNGFRRQARLIDRDRAAAAVEVQRSDREATVRLPGGIELAARHAGARRARRHLACVDHVTDGARREIADPCDDRRRAPLSAAEYATDRPSGDSRQSRATWSLRCAISVSSVPSSATLYRSVPAAFSVAK